MHERMVLLNSFPARLPPWPKILSNGISQASSEPGTDESARDRAQRPPETGHPAASGEGTPPHLQRTVLVHVSRIF
eukprot:scaffold24371_cov40-Prasinocladus_malaysianus.AAC.1